jgi:hypothetical protein
MLKSDITVGRVETAGGIEMKRLRTDSCVFPAGCVEDQPIAKKSVVVVVAALRTNLRSRLW